ncbi:unnamed protein product [Paramecium octaurelia]|uniref:Uncharacterized protein n=1 Tax=Paramecium octaurelia TaxID=43137 RepID=A0A8S1YP55_PAROT|nr:unnamed protein product [Paramecium octaurelia]
MFNISCPYQNHESNVEFFCINPFCRDPRLFCFEQCFQVTSWHQHDRRHINKIELLPNYLMDISNQCNLLQQEMKQLIQVITELFDQLEKLILKRFQWSVKKLKDLGGKQIEVALSNMINFDEFQRRLIQQLNTSSDYMIQTLKSFIQEFEVDEISLFYYLADQSIEI